MIRKLLRGVLKPILGKRKAAIVAQAIDHAAVRVIDKKTGGAASKLDEVI
jgi:hypothetical protein